MPTQVVVNHNSLRGDKAAPLVVALFGAPGSGKGTQASMLAEKMGYVHIATGNLLRDAVSDGSPLGQQVQSIMASGALVSDDLVLQLLASVLKKADHAPVVLDGFPRTIAQVGMLDQLLSSLGRHVDAVLFLDVPDSIIEDRLVGRFSCATCGASYHKTTLPTRIENTCDRCGSRDFLYREDDSLPVVQHRLRVYYQQTHPVLNMYRERNLVHDIAGQGGVSDIFTRILGVLQTDCAAV